MEINRDNPFVSGFILTYNEGDISLERELIRYVPSVNDILHPVTYWDNLSDLAHDYYGSSKWWWVIADANLVFDPFSLTPNSNLIIPSLDSIQTTL